MTNRWSVVSVLVLALTTYGCETANGGDFGTGGTGGIAGTGGMGGQGGMGGMAGEGGMGGMAGMGGEGGVGGMPDLCEDAATRCDDSDECTQNLCDPADGACSNPAVPDDTVCEFAPDVGGVCTAGVCEDAILCADAATRCDDSDECTQNLCDPADGACSNPAVPDDTVCEFAPGVGGVCTAGACEDAMLCADAATRCDDSNECTMDDCDPLDGSCSYTDEMNGIVCDAMGNSGSCLDGVCISDCSPTPDVMVVLPTSGPAIPTYTDIPNGFSISTAACSPPLNCTVAFNVQGGMGSSAYGTPGMDPLDGLSLQFFDLDSNSTTASNVKILLSPQGTSGTVDVRFDGGPVVQYPAILGQPIDLSPTSAHEIEVTMSSATGLIFWQALEYDHDCL